jgi:hypothetical protein
VYEDRLPEARIRRPPARSPHAEPRTSTTTVTFRRSFEFKEVDRALPANDYPVATDEELIASILLPVVRRVPTTIMVPGERSPRPQGRQGEGGCALARLFDVVSGMGIDSETV